MKETRKISELKGWDKNPRSIEAKDFERLKKQIQKLGVYKPLLITEDGTVLGGNMRLEALKALGQEEVWVSVVNAPDEATRLEYALSDNDRAGSYNEQELAELIILNPIELELFKADLGKLTPLNDLLDRFSPSDESEQGKLDELKNLKCPNCGHEDARSKFET